MISCQFEPIELSKIAEVFSGFAFKSEDLGDFDIPVVKIKNINGKRVDPSCDQSFPKDKLSPRLEKYFLRSQDILVAMTGQGSLGRFGRMYNRSSEYLVNQRVGIVRVFDEDECSPDYLYHVLSMDIYEEQLFSLGVGAGQPNVSSNDIGKLVVPRVHIVTQKKIAAILSAYDDLIENNKRRIALLEKMAEEIYREWFVRFRFPGYQDAEYEKGIPKGWGFATLEKAFKFLGGGTPSKDNDTYWKDGNVNWFTPSDITGANGIFLNDSADKPNDEGINNCSAKIFPAYSIMMTSRATIGELGINLTEACTNQGFITCIPNDQFPLAYLFFWLKQSKNYFISLCGGATFPEINKGTFKRIEILKPSMEVITEYRGVVDPIFKSIENLLSQNEGLAKTKALLLPRLISGKLSVEDLDIKFPPSMQEAD